MWLDENIPDKCVWAIIKLFSTTQVCSKCIKIKVTSTFTDRVPLYWLHDDLAKNYHYKTTNNSWTAMTCKLLANNVEWSIKTLMNGDVSLSLIGCFFVIKSNIAIFRQLHYLQHKRPWEFSVWTRTAIENNLNHSCKNGFSPLSYLYAICSH